MATEVSGYLDAAAARFIAESLRQHASEPTRIIGPRAVAVGLWQPHAEEATAARAAKAAQVAAAQAASPSASRTRAWLLANVLDYASEARIILTNAARESMERSDGIHVLAPSPLVRFGLRAANVILGDVYSYAERVPYAAALSTALRKRGG